MKPVASNFTLTPDEVSLVLRYRECTEFGQGILLQMAQAYADVYPRYIAPTLRLVREKKAGSPRKPGRAPKREPVHLRLLSGGAA